MTNFQAVENILGDLFHDKLGESIVSSETSEGSCRISYPLAQIQLSSVANQPFTVVSISRNNTLESGILDWKKLGAEIESLKQADLSNSTILSVKQILIDLLNKVGLCISPLQPRARNSLAGLQSSNFTHSDCSDPLRASEQRKSDRPDDMPDFDDEYDLKRNRHTSGFPHLAPIGDRDLAPTGAYPQMRPFIDPLASGPDGGGMYPSPLHPLFTGRRQGDDILPPGVPPGARYDDPFGGAGFKPPGGFPNGPGGFPNGPGGFF